MHLLSPSLIPPPYLYSTRAGDELEVKAAVFGAGGRG